MARKRQLTPKQRRFAAEYIVDLNATAAAVRAGYSARHAGSMAYQLLHKTPVRDEVQRLAAKRAERTRIEADDVVRALAEIAFLDPRRLFDDAGELLPVAEMPADVARAVASLDVSEDGKGTVTRKLKLWSKIEALKLLAQHLGMLRENVQHDVSITVATGVPRAPSDDDAEDGHG